MSTLGVLNVNRIRIAKNFWLLVDLFAIVHKDRYFFAIWIDSDSISLWLLEGVNAMLKIDR